MRPRVILHNAVSLDGRIDWFNLDVNLYYELAGQWQADAHLIGSRTVFNPAEPLPPEDESVFEPPPRVRADRRPLLVVPDSRGYVRNWHMLRTMPYWRGLMALCSDATPVSYIEYLRLRHITTFCTGGEQVDLAEALDELYHSYKIRSVLVDSGGTLNGALLRAGLVDEISLLIHPCLVGGLSPRSMFRAEDLSSSDGVIPLRLAHLERLRDDLIWLRYEVERKRGKGGRRGKKRSD